MIATYTGRRGQWRDGHGMVYYALALPNRRQRRNRRGLLRDFQAFVSFNRRVST